ncbi:hypothetical protein ACLOJK_022582, partial [Asimina triloba]
MAYITMPPEIEIENKKKIESGEERSRANPQEAASRFQEGLKSSIKRIVSAFRFERYSDMLNLAYLLEREEEIYNQTREQSRGTKSGGSPTKKQKPNIGGITYTPK